ncbi:vacuolar protein sorting-associated protein 41 [Anaeramoeba flamelloides]|uniref:Vacuolar protein sorting-associated protein 41 n=1 Tax=Anaeramoeba flamelloides TaxID=1746091 RepID=A0AAV7ZJT6_9EUKA|nr:vacuolar protein sorting-associated protein 41 [Anaeramoeba flamelloides]
MSGSEKEKEYKSDEEIEYESETDSESEEEDEPQFSYRRLKKDLADTLSDHNASCFHITPKFLILGTHQGSIYLFDHNGHKTTEYKAHETGINEISIDAANEVVATCSNDGKVFINELFNKESNTFQFEQPVRKLAIDPNYGKKTKQFIFGVRDGRVMMNQKTWFRSQDSQICKESSEITCLQWRKSHFIWSTKKGVTLHQISNSQTFKTIKIHHKFPETMYFRTIIKWISSSKFIYAHANMIKIFQIVKGSGLKTIDTHLFTFIICGIVIFKKRFVLLTLEDSEYKISIELVEKASSSKRKSKGKRSQKKSRSKNRLQYINDSNENSNSNTNSNTNSNSPSITNLQKKKLKKITKVIKRERKTKYMPNIRVFSRPNFEEMFTESLKIEQYEKYSYIDYQLENSKKTFYIISPNEIIKGREREPDERIKWFIERERYEDALTIGQQFPKRIKKYTIKKLGLLLLDYYFQNEMFDEIIEKYDQICNNDQEIWEKTINRFIDHNQLWKIHEKIPNSNPILSKEVYERILIEFLKNKWWQVFITFIHKWNKNLFHTENLLSTLEQIVKNIQSNSKNNQSGNFDEDDENDETNKENENDDDDEKVSKDEDEDEEERIKNNGPFLCLKEYYLLIKKYPQALKFMLSAKLGNPYQLIEKQGLYEEISNEIVLLFNFNTKETIKFLIQNFNNIQPSVIVTQLQKDEKYEKWLYYYLDSLFEKDKIIGRDYHELQLKLYIKYKNKEKILNLLKFTGTIRLENALQICEQNQLWEATAFIQDRMGNAAQALDIIVLKVNDIKKAIKLAQRENDSELWQQLITHCLKNSQYTSDLLDNITDTGVDVIKIIQSIPQQMQIGNLKNKIIKIMNDFKLQLELRGVTKEIIKRDYGELMKLLNTNLSQGMRVRGVKHCYICNQVIDATNEIYRVFFCGHSFHQTCLKETIKSLNQSNNNISISNKQKKSKDFSNVQKNTLVFGKKVNNKLSPNEMKNFKNPKKVSYYCTICEKPQNLKKTRRK